MSHSCYRVLASSPISRICPFSIALFLASATAFAMYARLRQQDDHDDKSENKDGERRSPTAEALDASQVVFVLGGPGAGYVPFLPFQVYYALYACALTDKSNLQSF